MSQNSVQSLLKSQISITEQMTKFVTNTKKTALAKRTHGFYLGRINGWHDLWQQFLNNEQQISLLKTAADLDNEYFTLDQFSVQENLFYEFKGELVDALEKLEKAEKANDPTIQRTVQSRQETSESNSLVQSNLPRISIPKFSGNYNDWISFHDLYMSVIHQNPNLENVQKFHYLKSLLIGEAANIIKHLSITNANYQTAWKALTERYQNKRFLISAVLKTFTSQSKISTETPGALKNLLDVSNECLASLSNLNINTLHWDPITIHLLTQKLPLETHKAWEESIGDSTDVPTWDQFKKFLESRFRTLEAISGNKPRQNFGKPEEKPKIQNFYSADSTCKLCKNKIKHSLRTCSKFLKLNPKDRLSLAKSKGSCLNCLGQYHSANKCLSTTKCMECGERHHTLLHDAMTKRKNEVGSNINKTSKSVALTYINKETENPSVSDVATYYVARNKQVLLATAIVYIKTAEGTHVSRALIDPGSQATFITNSALRRMKLRVSNTLVNVTGLGNSSTATSHRMATITITGPEATRDITVKAVALDTLTDLLPSKTIQRANWAHLHGLNLADPAFYTPNKVDILIGADIYPMIIMDGVKIGPPGTPLAQRTIFGWILTGQIITDNTARATSKVVSLVNMLDTTFELQKFWELEDVPSGRHLTMEEKFCEDFFQSTHFRKLDGSYVVRLPFKHLFESKSEPFLGSSRGIAMKRYLSLEKSLCKKGTLQEYNRVLEDYYLSNQMEEVPIKFTGNENETNFSYKGNYLPHHGVFKSSSSTTKLRVVFDASCKTTSGLSLNDTLFTGPPLQQDVSTIIIRWRFYRYVFTADIEKMYRQIWLHPDDANYQRILWRLNPKDVVRDYRLLTVTFGISCAPYLAMRTLHQLAEDEKSSFPVASECLLHDFYVDDVLTGRDSIPQVNTLKENLIALLQRGGFHLRKFSANHPDILRNLSPEDISPDSHVHLEGDNVVKALGIMWNPTEDIFQYKVNIDSNGPPTKRNILSKIAKLFDPLGWLSPIIIYGKILVQKLWLTGLDWDAPIPKDLQDDWYAYSRDLKEIENIKIPRWIECLSTSSLEFHGFCDSSEKAYAAAVYARVKTAEGNVIVHLLIAKTKVAPVKAISLPRLELCGAHLLSKLVKHLRQTLIIEHKFHLWTDSTIVLAWLNGHPNRWKSFVANRVADIQSNVPGIAWHHIPSEDNPADTASRGVFASNLVNNTRWWEGPSWLCEEENKWPKENLSIDNLEEPNKEMKKIRTYQITTENAQVIERFSNYTKACRVIAYCHRFIEKIKPSFKTQFPSYLSAKELTKARLTFIKQCQQRAYQEEIADLEAKRPISKQSSLISLHPFLDENNILRVGGRFEHAHMSFERKHPIILPRQAKLTSLLIDHIHNNTMHGGPNLILSQIRNKYWISGVKVTIRQRLHLCFTCQRWKRNSPAQIMGNLPRDRITFERPFYAVGVDFAGPINIKLSKTRNAKIAKAYIAIFVCFATKAIHIEVVSDLSSEAFLASLRRFFSRRGVCKEIYTDNGTNFVGASKILGREIQEALKNNLPLASQHCANQNITWHFIPPGAPHFGGLWEAGVKSIKYHLRRIVGQANLTYEELTTVLIQIEAVLNSRPLCPLSSDPEDFNSLTPGHFLIGDAPLSLPEIDWNNSKITHLSRWQHLQKLRNDFWRRWVSEYLPRLQQRHKWKTEQPSVHNGDLVLLKEDNIPPSGWKFARIIEVHPGKDNRVRVVTLKTPYTILKRPINKICLLPFHKEDQQ